ncbi:MAG TPA: hypothetical protein EYH31_13500 [Anaerolineae bacterium]|nr:hypothetical protein [Anaerolineae bacterium]
MGCGVPRLCVEEHVEAENPLKATIFGAVLGTGSFVEWVRGKLDGRDDDREIAGLVQAIARPTLAAIGETVAAEYGVEVCDVRAKGRKQNEARDVAIYLSRECSGCKHTEIGRHFGRIRPSAVSLACRRVVEREDKGRSRRVLRLGQQLEGKV